MTCMVTLSYIQLLCTVESPYADLFSNSYLVAKLLRVHVIDVRLGVVLGPLAINKVQSLGLNFTVDEGTNKTSQKLLGFPVVRGRAYS